MTSLGAQIVARVRAQGPLSIAEYMSECLFNPDHGYYATRDPLGAQGDFTTAPEISQMFGELLGLSLAQSWLDQGAPSPFRLVELGPGRGTLMADLLRATVQVPGFHDALSLHLVEASQTLRGLQTRTIGKPFTHHNSLETVPEGPLFLIANEFFDALPIRQFQRDALGWRERLIGLEEDTLSFGLSDPTAPQFLAHRCEDTKEGDIVETSPASLSIARDIGARIARDGGVSFIIDYGDWRSLGDTLQAIENHEPSNPLSAPGQADLTAHVDFEAIAEAVSPAATTRLTPQGVFLERLGITQRAQSIAKGLAGDALESHIAAHRRLTHPQEMGTLFKAIAVYQKDTALPAGFAP